MSVCSAQRESLSSIQSTDEGLSEDWVEQCDPGPQAREAQKEAKLGKQNLVPGKAVSVAQACHLQ